MKNGFISSQARKYASYCPGGFGALESWVSFDGTNETKVAGSSAEYVNASTIQKILFLSDTCSAIAATITNPQRATAGYANKSTAGYTLGGESAAGVATNKIDKLLFAGETTSTLSATMSQAVFASSGGANETTAGYTFGGFGTSAALAMINKMTFSNETNGAISATLATARHNHGTVTNGPTAIYNISGQPGTVTEIRKLTLSNETMSILSAVLSAGSSSRFHFSNVGTAGYVNGQGNNFNNFANTIDKLTYSNETRTSLTTGAQSLAGRWAAQSSNANIAGYHMGGAVYDASNRDNVTRRNLKFPFSTESLASLSSPMTTWQRQVQGYAYSL